MPPRLSEAEIEKARVLYEESRLSVLALVRETGLSQRTIYYYASRRGWKSRAARRGPRLPLEQIRALYEHTIVPVAEIARIAGVALSTIHVYAARHGWKTRASRLRGKGAVPRDAVADPQAEADAARRRAEEFAEEKEARAEERRLERTTGALAAIARRARRLRAAKGRSGGSAPEPVETESERAARQRETVAIIDRALRMREGRE